MTLHELLRSKQEETLNLWMSMVRGSLAPELMAPIELANHFPKFLKEIISALRTQAGLKPQGDTPEESDTASDHGEQRLRLGFSLDSVVREYGALREAVVETARAHAVAITIDELQVVFDASVTGIAKAVSEYSRQRDAELHRSANEHVAFIAHELRNPLSSAVLALKVLQKNNQIPNDTRAGIALTQGLTQMSALLDHSLELARIGSGIELRPEWITLGTLLEGAELEASADADDKRVAIKVEKVEVDDARVCVDARLLRSALGNLVRNAVKYSSSGGQVDLRGRFAHGRITIEVEDACGGLPPGKVEEAFAPFVRLASDQKGFGLGLAIAKQAVDAHGGTLRVQNLPRKGCIFVLELQSGGN
jgi:signal transduction histidine kinase